MPKKKAVNAAGEIEMSDGTALPLRLSWGLLYKLRGKDRSAYERLSGLVTKGFANDMIAALQIVYCAYLCAHIGENDSLEGALTEDEFVACAPDDVAYVMTKATELIAPKAAKAFAERSKAEQSS